MNLSDADMCKVWLDHLDVHMRNVTLEIMDLDKYVKTDSKVDGYDPETNTVYIWAEIYVEWAALKCKTDMLSRNGYNVIFGGIPTYNDILAKTEKEGN